MVRLFCNRHSPRLCSYDCVDSSILLRIVHSFSNGIRVNVVAPGPVWTPLQVSGGQPTEKLAQFGAQTPLDRPAQPAELAPAYVFLASAESSFVSGETLTVTGGMPTP